MSTSAKASETNGDECCRSCNGDVCAKYTIDSVSSDGSSFTLRGIEGPNVKKSCDKSISSKADLKLDFTVAQELTISVESRIQDLVNNGYYLERGRTFKGCASFEASVCVDNDEVNIDISEFDMNKFA